MNANSSSSPEGFTALKRLVCAFEQIDCAIVIIEPEKGVVEWNAAAGRMFGWSKGEALGKWREVLQLQNGGPLVRSLEVKPWTGKSPFTRKDGSIGVCALQIAPLQGGAPEFRGVLLSYQETRDFSPVSHEPGGDEDWQIATPASAGSD